MQNQAKPQVDSSVETAFDFANMSFIQLQRVTELALEQARVNAELAQEQLSNALEIKDPAAALELLKTQLENSAKSLAGFAATAFELSQKFQAEGTALAEGHFDHVHTAANKALIEARKNVKKTADLAHEGVAQLKAQAPKAAAKAPARRKPRA